MTAHLMIVLFSNFDWPYKRKVRNLPLIMDINISLHLLHLLPVFVVVEGAGNAGSHPPL